MYKFWLPFFIVVVLSFPTLFPLFHEGFFPMHDDTQIVRVDQMVKALRDGQFPVRWVADLGYGYGYPIFNFYAPLPYYFGAVLVFIGFSSLVATKIMFGVGILFAAVSMFVLARHIYGTLPALIASLLYQYAPYHAIDIYVRGAVGEFWALSILPLLLYSIVLSFEAKNRRKGLLLLSLSFSLLILSHNITAFVTAIFIGLGYLIGIFYAVVFPKKRTIVITILTKISLFLLIGAGIASFFWLPALIEAKYTNVASAIGAGARYSDHFLYADQLWDSTWGFGGSSPGRADGMSFKVGKIHLAFAFFSLLYLIWQFTQKHSHAKLVVFNSCLAVITVLSFFMSLTLSQYIWDLFPLLAYIQYPWRFLVFIVLGVSLLGSSLFMVYRDKAVVVFTFVIIALIVGVNYKYFTPQTFIVLPAEAYQSDEYVKWRASKMSDEYMPPGFEKPTKKEGIVSQKIALLSPGVIQQSNLKTDEYTVRYDSDSSTTMHIKTAYFPGWNIFIDGVKYPYTILDSGLQINVPEGNHRVIAKRYSTGIEKAANMISLFSSALLFGTIIQYGKKNIS